jgi:hypothetical protein
VADPNRTGATRYAGWPALKKLEYMDALMRELAGKPMLVRQRRRVEPLQSAAQDAARALRAQAPHYGVEHPHFYDRDLRKLFSDTPGARRNMKAARFIARVRGRPPHGRGWTGEYQYTIDQVLENMIKRANELNLRLTRPEEREARLHVMLTVQTMNYLHSGRHTLN